MFVAPDLLLAERGERDREDAEQHPEDREEGGRDRKIPRISEASALPDLPPPAARAGRACPCRPPVRRPGVQRSHASVRPLHSPPWSFALSGLSFPVLRNSLGLARRR